MNETLERREVFTFYHMSFSVNSFTFNQKNSDIIFKFKKESERVKKYHLWDRNKDYAEILNIILLPSARTVENPPLVIPNMLVKYSEKLKENFLCRVRKNHAANVSESQGMGVQKE